MTGAEELRRTVNMINGCSEDFLDRFTLAQLVTICRAWRAAQYDYPPDTWTQRQVTAAIRGVVPRWTDAGAPIEHSTIASAWGRVAICVEGSA